MHIFLFAFYAAGVLYGCLNQPQLVYYFLYFVGGYILISACLPGSKSISKRKKIMVATWSEPSEGVIHLNVEVRVEKVLKAIEEKKDQKITMTHFVIKAVGQIIKKGPDLNGKLVFGKFVPYQTIDVSCLVDIDGGNDLAMLLIKEVDKKSVEDIGKVISENGSKIKKNKGDDEHKKRTQMLDYLPTYLVTCLIEIVTFITYRLGLNVPIMSMKKNQFGCSCVTSLGMLGFENATAPFTGFTGVSVLASANAVHQKPVVQNGNIVVGKVMNVNFVVDHRYVDGGRCKPFVPTFKKLFQSPQLFMDVTMKKID